MSKVKQQDTLQDETCRVFKGKLREFVNCNLTFILLKIHTFGKCSGGLLYESKRRNLLHYMTPDKMTQPDRVSADISCPQEVIPALTSLTFSSPAFNDDLLERALWITTYKEWFDAEEA